ncbi:hypothetical protein [Psychrobacter sp. FDAARGOS_221]|uniref:hypothetical protein n=1 Tax=Psychrobacter sp. FDAARGOS_221 TaxID=1975705 RepID=UPI000BB5385B|nr:hypothetical protein [Psychrobacter sp. FDAARGOS_221]PNK61413.1 hypothetical protein A6J60_011430 [Psychrobacter sp. FDAARGOS_221]
MSTPDPYSKQENSTVPTKKTNTFKKWLPAIILAIAIHILIITLLIINNHRKSAEEAEQAPAVNETPSLTEEPEVLLTLTEEESEEEDAEGEEDEEDTDKEGEEENDEDKESDNDDDEKDKKDDKQTSKENDNNNASNANNRGQSATNNSGSAQNSYQPNTAPPAYTPPQPEINPNERVLLPRDVPDAQATRLAQQHGFSETAQSAQQLSDQLSDAINEVKEQKLRQIAEEQGKNTADFINTMKPKAQSAEAASPQAETPAEPKSNTAANDQAESEAP